MAFAGRVLILVENLPVPMDRRVWLESTSLTKAGYKVSVICPRNKQDKKYEELEGVKIYRYLMPPETKGILSFFYEFIYCWVNTFWLTLKVFFKDGIDVIQTCNPPDNFFTIGLFYKLFRKKFVFDQHDLCPEVYQSRFNRKDFLYKALLLFEKMTYKTANMVISTNESYKEMALSRGKKKEEDVFVVRTGPDLSRIRIPKDKSPQLKKGKDFLVCYLGVMGPQDGVDYLIRSIDEIINKSKRKNMHFALIGKGDSTDELKEMAANLGLQNFVEFTGRVPDDILFNYLTTADICVCPDPKNPLNDKSTMNKTMEYMAFAKPIVAYDLKETAFSAGKAAVYAKANDEKDFAQKIIELADNPEKRIKMGEYGKQRIENELAWQYNEKNLINAYKHLFS